MDEAEMAADLKMWKPKILTTLYEEGELEASELREKVGYPPGSKGLHPDTLEEWGLIKVIARVGANNERKFALTDRGREFTIDHILSGNILSGDIEEQIEYLKQRVTDQERKINQLQNERGSVSQAEFEDFQSEAREIMEDLIDEVDELYKRV